MISRIEGNKETVYTYDLDRLVQIQEKEDGVTTDTQTLTYDNAGNLITDGEFTYTWQMGRQLQGIVGTDLTISYKYNENGLRTGKTVNGQTHEYTLLGSTVTREVIRDNAGNILWTIHYSYAGEGTPVSMNVNGTEYYYLKNAQGDITHIVDEDGNEVAAYEYDAWGNHLSITGGEIAQLNPHRYRGYRYDSETGLYYLQSRYYNPEWGRFVNADNQITTGSDLTGMSLFAYCGNNPVMRVDPTGHAWYHWAIGAVIVVACAVAVVATAGGAAPALLAVASVANEMAAATAASTIAAGAFIGSSMVLGTAALVAAASSNSVQEFADQGNWGKVAATAGGAVLGGASAYSTTKSTTLGKGIQNPKVKAAVQKGQEMHKQMDYGPGTLKEITIAPKCRVDGIDFTNRIIYELKPNNAQAIARGMNQLIRFTSAAGAQFGGEWTGVLKLYD